MSGSGDLVVEDLHVQYGPAKALFGISLEVTTGSVLAVLGPNGAGKARWLVPCRAWCRSRRAR